MNNSNLKALSLLAYVMPKIEIIKRLKNAVDNLYDVARSNPQDANISDLESIVVFNTTLFLDKLMVGSANDESESPDDFNKLIEHFKSIEKIDAAMNLFDPKQN